MDILGIGPLELLLILIIALVVLGPKDMVKAGRTIGRFLRVIVTSDTWKVINQASRDIRNLPNRLIREAGLEDLRKDIPTAESIRKELDFKDIEKEIKQDLDQDISDWTTPPPTIAPPKMSLANEQPPDDQTELPESSEEPEQPLKSTTKETPEIDSEAEETS